MTEEIQILKEIEKAALLCEKNYTREDIFNILKTPSDSDNDIDIEKQICILKLQDIKNAQEADLLMFHLTGHHGLIREACAQKINEFLKSEQYSDFFQTKENLNTLLKAVNDINPNICRLICEILPFVQDKDYFLEILYERFDTVFAELEQLKRSNWYTKKLFNLYWCLEALGNLYPPDSQRLEDIILKTSKFRDYTIREKTAMVLSRIKSDSTVLQQVKEQLKQDENFYVKRYASIW